MDKRKRYPWKVLPSRNRKKTDDQMGLKKGYKRVKEFCLQWFFLISFYVFWFLNKLGCSIKTAQHKIKKISWQNIILENKC